MESIVHFIHPEANVVDDAFGQPRTVVLTCRSLLIRKFTYLFPLDGESLNVHTINGGSRHPNEGTEQFGG